ncbi:RNA polymerase sigma-70 factor (ECF subfamily) [Leeuwenhoekiella aestuarii]|uniref:RNA polymerase sigma-70 factor (ECF subfamily) n=1 Tax=Leeuwenhoekiella aestuarii TaxID=2249426 RepID=A0A4Q0NPQ0_9FLAO|nr:DUF6596 domain-containing protein [Leeuwenhoekiella aestuarii]RXG11510.1 RNA polymerase sigma-70 factor (ECF subfamily) [Leeuwenhoekiella aestuarii]RXG12027.1 RNA polymerase sigma-70 factor (ECF subfamily) [Leeuwenhoekiella aestuarii]
MKNNISSLVESSYRTFYGKLFSALFSQFGANYISEIEDAIQNSFYKSLKSWKPNQVPDNKENWLFIVARNDIINQIKKDSRLQSQSDFITNVETENLKEDLRLKTILFLSKSKKVSSKVKVIFVLKNIFGLHIKEISECTLLSQDAIYKSINRAKKDFRQSTKDANFDLTFEQIADKEIEIVEEILYAVFNIGFDSFNEKTNSIINEDLCLEALSLSKILSDKFQQVTTKNLLALFCFHLARIPSKVKNDKIISFFEQDKTNWNQDFIKLGFHYLEKPEKLNKYYIEALIASKHMTATKNDIEHWNGIIELYQLLISVSNSPITKLNLCYCLSKAQRIEEAKELLEIVENELPNEHIYLSLVKANIFVSKQTLESEKIIDRVLKNINQNIRREYILENMSADF